MRVEVLLENQFRGGGRSPTRAPRTCAPRRVANLAQAGLFESLPVNARFATVLVLTASVVVLGACGEDAEAEPPECQAPGPSPEPGMATIVVEGTGRGFVVPQRLEVHEGSSATFHLVPARGHRIARVAGDCCGEIVGADFVVSAPTGSCTIRPVFDAIEREDVAALFEPRSIPAGDQNLTYHVYRPRVAADTAYPLILAVHGTTEGAFAQRGDPPNPHLIDRPGETLGRPVATAWVQPHVRDNYPSYVVAPLLPFPEESGGQWYDDAIYEVFGRIIDELIATEPIDTDRIYVVGHSVGAGVAWSIPAVLRQRFAALLPLAGGWIPPDNGMSFAETVSAEYAELSVWNFGHVGDVDGSVERTRALHETMGRQGLGVTLFDSLDIEESRRSAFDAIMRGSRYLATEYNFPCDSPLGSCHWAATDAAGEEPLLLRWLFAQRRAGRESSVDEARSIPGGRNRSIAPERRRRRSIGC